MPEISTVYTISPSADSTLAVEVLKRGVTGRKTKTIFFFESFGGEIRAANRDPAGSQIVLTIDASSIICRDARLTEKKRRAMTAFAREKALVASRYPEIKYESTCIRAKPLRGFLITGVLQIRGVNREMKVNMTWNAKQNDEFQLDGDSTAKLSDFDLPRPSAQFGLARTIDEVTIHLLLWARGGPSIRG